MPRRLGSNAAVAWLRAAGDPSQTAGAAFLLGPEVAVTCAHVVREHLGLGTSTPRERPTGTLTLRLYGLRGREVTAEVAECGWWPDGCGEDIEDVAVLRLLEPVDEVRCAGLATVAPRPQESCYVYGAVGGYVGTGQTVYVTIAAQPGDRGWHQLDPQSARGNVFSVQRGFSGAPVFDELGNVVWGMVAQVYKDGLPISFLIPADLLFEARTAVERCARRAGQTVPAIAVREEQPLDALARDTMTAVRERGGVGGEALDEPALEGVRDAVGAVAATGAQPAARDAAAAALHRLAEGDPTPAERLLATPPAPRFVVPTGVAAVVGHVAKFLGRLVTGPVGVAPPVLGDLLQSPSDNPLAHQAAAEALRRIGALASLHDTTRSLAAYRQAAELDPADAWTRINIARLERQAGRLAASEQAASQARTAALAAGDRRNASVVLDELGDMRRAQGDLAGALKAYEDSRVIAERLASSDPGNAGWQRDLSVSWNRVGDVRVAQGDLAGALKAYEQDLAIAERLASSDPGDTGLQRDLSVSWEKVGNVRRAQGGLTGALKAYEDSRVIAERLASSDPGNAGLQRDLSVSWEKVGDVRRAQGDVSGALKAYEDSLAIRERLAALDPGNAGLQRDLSVSWNKVGDVRVAQGDLAGALQAYEDSRAIAERLALSDLGNAEWQRDLIVSYWRLAEVAASDDRNGARERYAAALAVARRLADEGRLAPVDAWFVADLERRLGEHS